MMNESIFEKAFLRALPATGSDTTPLIDDTCYWQVIVSA